MTTQYQTKKINDSTYEISYDVTEINDNKENIVTKTFIIGVTNESQIDEMAQITINGTYPELNTPYSILRQQAYPPITDYLDGIVKNDQTQIQKYINDCLAVKTKFPKS
jgi:hypothetical protein